MFLFSFVWVFFIVATVLVASSKNRNAVVWGVAAAFVGVFALIVLACCGKLPAQAEAATQGIAPSGATASVMKVCPRCAEEIKVAALICRFCQHEFDSNPSLNVPQPHVPL